MRRRLLVLRPDDPTSPASAGAPSAARRPLGALMVLLAALLSMGASEPPAAPSEPAPTAVPSAPAAGAATATGAVQAAPPVVAPTAEPARDIVRDERTGRPKLVGKPSGFWTSPVPAKGGAYRYRMLGIGVALVLITGLVTIAVLRRHGVRVPDRDRPYAKPRSA